MNKDDLVVLFGLPTGFYIVYLMGGEFNTFSTMSFTVVITMFTRLVVGMFP